MEEETIADQEIEAAVSGVRSASRELIDVLRERMDRHPKLYMTTPIVWAFLNRVRANCDALVQMIEVHNDYGCLMVSRVILEDSLIAVAANLHSRGYHGLFVELLKGKRITNIKLKGNRTYTYSQLCDENDKATGNPIGLSRAAYQRYSDFVHFSGSNLHTTIRSLSDDGKLEMVMHLDSFDIRGVGNEDRLNWLNGARALIFQTRGLVKHG